MIYIDVSHYDYDRFGGNLNWTQIKASGIDVVFIRASYGDPSIYNPETRYFVDMATAASAAGLMVGGYHNLINGDFSSIQRQVQYFRDQLELVDADYAMLDVEPYEALKANNLWPRLSSAELFAQEFNEQDSRPLAVYLAQWVWSSWLNRGDLRPLMTKAAGPLINSNYPLGVGKGEFKQLYTSAGGDKGPGWISYGNVAPEIWQYSSNAMVPGASSVTDVNAYRFSVEEFMARMARKDVELAWSVVPALAELRTQLDNVFPKRDHASDGTIGDYAHSQEDSSHNPDDTGKHNAEWDTDPDGKQEVRAVDIDIDFKDSRASAQELVNHLIKYAKNGTFWWLRYIIYNRKIYHKSSEWIAQDYTGTSPHTEHIHVNNDFTTAADNVSGVNYRLSELVEVATVATQFNAEDIAALNNAAKSITVTTAWATGGGNHSPVGDGVWNTGIPVKPGAADATTNPRLNAWDVIRQLHQMVTAIKAVTDGLDIRLDAQEASDTYLKQGMDQLTADVFDPNNVIVADVQYAIANPS